LSPDTTLEPVLRTVEPALRLVHERHLRQILYFLIDRGRALPANTDLPFWFTRDDLIAADILPNGTLQGTEPRLLLVTNPDDRLIAEKPQGEQLRVYWRMLFRASVLKAIDTKVTAGALDAEKCREQFNRFGPAAAREIRFVLESEHLLAPEAGDMEAYRTFAAVYLDFDQFTAHAAADFFPTLPDRETVRAALREDVAIEVLFASSRPAGALEPDRDPHPEEVWSAPPAGVQAETTPPPPEGVSSLLQRADTAERKGNLVRAAILRTQAAKATHGLDRERAMQAALTAGRQLVDRLGDELKWDSDTREEWMQALGPMLPLAASGEWPRAARCLYELQRIPADLAREIFAVELPEYIRTLGRRPIRRPLPHARPVMVLMALRKAHTQLLRAGLGEPEQLRLDRLLHHEIHRREHAIRHEFTPIIVTTLTNAGLTPTTRVEEVARDKLVAELLDRVCERGYLRIGDLRDAVARNQLKLGDLRGIGEFVSGDALLRADTGLAYALDGVYRRGEFYLRWIQRFVSVFFGTPWGRALTLYLALPFGGAFLALMFAEELRHIGGNIWSFVSRSINPPPPPVPPPSPPPQVLQKPVPAPPPDATAGRWEFDEETQEFAWKEDPPPPPDPLDQLLQEQRERAALALEAFTSSASREKPEAEHHASFLIQWPTVVGFGVFLLLVFHVPPFRRAVFWILRNLWRVIRGVLWDIPTWVWRSEVVRNVRLSRTARFLHRHFATPLLLSLLFVSLLFLTGLPLRVLLWFGWLAFVVLLVAYNTEWGWEFQDRVAAALSDWWRRVRVNLLPGIIAIIIDAFRTLANWVERRLYAVDEWMRFRSGDSQSSLALKAILGLLWFPFAYLTRFAFYLLVEPQVNPVKHFPVVTVSHKVIWPMVPQIATWTGVSPWTVGMIVNGIPGIFGFIAWELKENWRLYAANRSKKLTPAMVGSHGESMRGLLRPGFHSGTVPKLFSKMRKAIEQDDRAKAARMHHDLEHTTEGVHRFAERELVPFLTGSHEWNGIALEVTAVRFGVQRTEVEFVAPSLGRDPFILALENINGGLDARIVATGWADKLTDTQRESFVFALRGLLDLAAAATFNGQVRTENAPAEPAFGMLVRSMPRGEWVKRWDGTKSEAVGTE